ncbi:MAG: 16S rRNA (guanine(966)-N(2))-methyltransferase RsmD [Bacteroidales bacterium]|nr:16S rRNA (guanine(966)-N(2))-methyltransferase RsmD [Bacteroidales bacterium]
MRIISGELRGRVVNAPKNFDLRPTTDMAKEGLFNVLNNEFDFSEISVLDLFSGIGSISLECVSRGCTDVVSVEMNAKHAAFIKQTAASFKIKGMKVLNSEVRDFLRIANREFDLIFADPPYSLPWISEVPNFIYASKAVNSDTLVIVEHPAEVDFSQHPNFARLCKYGKVHFSFFRTQK